MRLYHFTSEMYLETILQCGYLKVCESNIGAPGPPFEGKIGEHVGPDVCWLTDLRAPTKPLGLDPPHILPPGAQWAEKSLKDRVRFTLELPDHEVHKWEPWARERGIDPDWFAVLASFAVAKHVYLIERPVPREEWAGIHRWVPDMNLWLPVVER
jgi:hypothetical protein